MDRIKLISCLLILSISNLIAYGQWKKVEFGEISNEEFSYNQCSFDKKADAVVLFDSGETFFIESADGIEMVYVRHTRVKILTEAGIYAASFRIPLYNGKTGIETLYNLQGTSFNKTDGNISTSSLDKKTVFTEKVNERWDASRFTFPDVRPGTIIDLQYSVSSPYVFQFRDWDFQSELPVVHSQYKARMIPFYEYIYMVRGNTQKIIRKEYEDKFSQRGMFGHQFNERVYEFSGDDFPGSHDEKFAPESDDYKTRIDFQLCTIFFTTGGKEQVLTTWDALVKDYLDDSQFGKYVKKAVAWGSKNLPVDSLSTLSDVEKIRYVTNYVKTNFRSDGLLRWSTVLNDFNVFIKQHEGNSANVNLFAAGLLKSVGLDAVPVVLSTRANEIIAYDYPFRHYFDYAIALVRLQGGNVLVDATDPVIPAGELPLDCYNEKGLIIEKGEPKWCQLPLPGYSSKAINITARLNDDGNSMAVDMQCTLRGFDASELRRKLMKDPESLKDFFKKNASQSFEGNTTLQDEHDISKPVMVSAQGTIPVKRSNNLVLINPFLAQSPGANPFAATERTLPVFFPYTGVNSFFFTLDLPEHYAVKQIPESSTITFNSKSLQYTAKTEGNKVLISGQYSINRVFFPVDEYTEVRLFFNDIVKVFNQELIIEKVD